MVTLSYDSDEENSDSTMIVTFYNYIISCRNSTVLSAISHTASFSFNGKVVVAFGINVFSLVVVIVVKIIDINVLEIMFTIK